MKIGVIADDLTGGNATGVRLVKQGFKAATVVHSASVPSGDDYDVLILDTDSRYMKKEVAQGRINRAMTELTEWGATLFSKRIDSTIRGNIGIEIDQMLEHLDDNAVSVVIPSFPESGRIVIGGYLLVDGIPAQETFVSKDPVTPITQSYVPAILAEQTKHPVGFIGLADVLNGGDAFLEVFKTNIKEGNRVIVVDAVTNEQIEDVAEVLALQKEVTIVPADPGPFTAAYSRAVTKQKIDQTRILVSVGSATTLTGQQLEYLTEKTNANPVYVNPELLASYTDTWEKEVERATKAALEAGKEELILIVTTHRPGQKLVNLKAKALQENTSEEALAKRITDGLAKISRLVLSSEDLTFSGCFTSGGDVSASLCAIGQANGIALNDEVLPLAAYGTFVGGYFDKLPVVTKGGLVGDKTSIYTCIKYLLTKVSK